MSLTLQNAYCLKLVIFFLFFWTSVMDVLGGLGYANY
jgi:hypothetical protein